jgi:hypothetical protein
MFSILIATSRRGNDGEINSLRFFVEELEKKDEYC